jgi:hypothetical protein
MNGNTTIHYIGGSKGGVGKSLFSFALTDYLLNQKRNVLLVDTDTDNPDVFKAHDTLEFPNMFCMMNSLDDADGWAELLDTVQRYPAHTAVINAAARTKTSTASYGEIMRGALREMQRELAVFWIINRQRDSIELLHSFQQAFPDTVIHVCRNLHFGEPERFDSTTLPKRGKRLNRPARRWIFRAWRTGLWTGSIPDGCPSAPRILRCPSAHGRNCSVGGDVARQCLTLQWRKRHERGRYHPYQKVTQ